VTTAVPGIVFECVALGIGVGVAVGVIEKSRCTHGGKRSGRCGFAIPIAVGGDRAPVAQSVKVSMIGVGAYLARAVETSWFRPL